MNNYIQDGDTVSLTAPAAVSSGDGKMIGALFGVAKDDIANGVTGPFQITGVVSLPKDGVAEYTVGEIVYWDDTDLRCEESATGLFPIGVAVEVAGASDGTCKVLLAATPLTAVP